MKYSERIHYQHSSVDLLQMFSNPEFFKAKYSATGARDIQVLAMEKGSSQKTEKIVR